MSVNSTRAKVAQIISSYGTFPEAVAKSYCRRYNRATLRSIYAATQRLRQIGNARYLKIACVVPRKGRMLGLRPDSQLLHVELHELLSPETINLVPRQPEPTAVHLRLQIALCVRDTYRLMHEILHGIVMPSIHFEDDADTLLKHQEIVHALGLTQQVPIRKVYLTAGRT
jgi:hypothetical protein